MIRGWLALAGAGWLWCAVAFGADAGVSASVRVEVQMVSVSIPEACLLVPQLQDARTAQGAFDRVQEMLAQDKAVLVGWPIVWLRCDPSSPEDVDRGVGETILEYRYPNDFDPPSIPQTFGPVPPRPPLTAWGFANLTSTGFETRNTGASLETEASVEENGRIIALNLVPQFVSLPEMREFRIPPSPWGVTAIIVQPVFTTIKSYMALRVVHDRPTLINTFILEGPEPRVALFILRARATVLPPAAFAATTTQAPP